MNRSRSSPLLGTLLVFALTLSGCERGSGSPAIDTSVFGPEVRRQLDAGLEASRRAPDDAAEQGRLGMLLHAYQLLEPAAEAYGRAAVLEPENFRWRYYRGRALSSAGRNAEALALLTEALPMREDYAPGWVAIADLLLESGDAEAAERHYRKAVEVDPLSARALYGLAKSLRARGDLEAAAEAYRTTLRLQPRFGAAHYSLGLLYRDQGDADRATEHLLLADSYRHSQAPARDPLMGEVVNLAAGAADLTKSAIDLYGEGKVEAAIANLDAAVELDPEFVPARVNLIKIHGDAGRYDLAEKHYRAAIEVSPNAQQARFNYARALIQQTRLAEAQTELERVVEINPHLADAQVLLGSLFEEQGLAVAAVRHYELALESKPAHPQGNLMLVKHRLAAGRIAEADSHARRLLAAETTSLPILVFRLGLFYEQAGLRPQARDYLLRARGLAESAGRTRLVGEIDSRLEGWS